MLQARLAKVDLGIDHAGQHVQATAVEHLLGLADFDTADLGNTAAADPNVAHSDTVVIDDSAAAQREVVAIGRRPRPGCVTSCPRIRKLPF